MRVIYDCRLIGDWDKAYICVMYIPDAFKIEDPEIIRTFLKEHAFGTLVVNGPDGFPVAAHLPFLWCFESEGLFAEGHLSKNNPLAALLAKGCTAKIIVMGEHGYVSSSVYGHLNVPTYNYQAVHLYGITEVFSGKQLTNHLQKVVEQFEQNRIQPLQFAVFPEEMMHAYQQEIIGFRLDVFKKEVAFKLSQNRNPDDFERIVNDLMCGNPAQQRLAQEMKRWVSGK